MKKLLFTLLFMTSLGLYAQDYTLSSPKSAGTKEKLKDYLSVSIDQNEKVLIIYKKSCTEFYKIKHVIQYTDKCTGYKCESQLEVVTVTFCTTSKGHISYDTRGYSIEFNYKEN